MSTILVTDANRKNSLAIVRSLSKKGHNVYCAGNQKINKCFLSKHCKKKFVYHNPNENKNMFINDLLNIIKNYDIDILLPVSVDTTVAISYFKKRFEKHTIIPISDYDILIKAHNKESMLKIAEECHVSIPKTCCPSSQEELIEIADTMQYPVVIKPRKSSASRGVQYAQSKKELIKKYSLSNKKNETFDFTHPLIQEYIPGEIHDVCLLCDNGKTIAGLTQRRIWTYPVNGGGGVINQTTQEPELMRLATVLTKELKWNGVTQVEFKIDSRNNMPKLMEVNPKFWGTLELSIAAGISFPDLLCKLALKEEMKELFEYQKNLNFIWVNAGLFSNFIQSENLLQTIKEFRKIRKDKHVTNLSIDDALPHLFIFYELYKSITRKLHP